MFSEEKQRPWQRRLGSAASGNLDAQRRGVFSGERHGRVVVMRMIVNCDFSLGQLNCDCSNCKENPVVLS